MQKMNNASTVDILDRGLAVLFEHLGTIETERFISTIMRERFDYTKWRREFFKDITVDEMIDAAVAYDRAHPIKAKNL